MNGMHILEQTPIKDFTKLSWTLVVLGVMVAIGSLIVYGIKNQKRKKDKGAKKVVFGYIIGLALIISSMFYRAETGLYTYKCTFDTSVTINEVGEKFKIISFENGIWTVEDKENNNEGYGNFQHIKKYNRTIFI